ncbi:hypothetical protein E6R60_15140 [Streptomyces sp. A0642]|uniref:hypothetical protein n=1 Tax=unclassified Streptomyces TaxID=2593676 RepID=UPI0010A26748|nr:hypothetical protein [Streptomyces sp. A0642]THA76079.1 hypothetical protein E6R60_15140 [Streptomyces sp. A0642]
MNEQKTDSAAAARQARFGKLPARIRYEDMVEDQAAGPSGGADNRYNPEGSWNHFNCLAFDLGL